MCHTQRILAAKLSFVNKSTLGDANSVYASKFRLFSHPFCVFLVEFIQIFAVYFHQLTVSEMFDSFLFYFGLVHDPNIVYMSFIHNVSDLINLSVLRFTINNYSNN